MCGIAGILRNDRDTSGVDAHALVKMTDIVAHRGPDGEGKRFFSLSDGGLRETNGDDTAWRIGLGHRRLSILDLSPSGAQPMQYRGRRASNPLGASSGDASLWITYNGEIYNFVELRSELERLGHAFRSKSDTEVILAAYAEWGTECFAKMRGMWGLLIVDGVRRRAVVSRDRLGIKPLYLFRRPGLVAVASEIKQLASLPGPKFKPSEEALLDYVATGYEDTKRTFFSEVDSLQAGTFMTIALDDLVASAPISYWHPERVRTEIGDRREAALRFHASLKESVRIHLRSDVPVGCALSGGLDSSSVAAMTRALSGGKDGALHTFTATFPGESIDERPWVDRVVRHTHAESHFVEPTADDLIKELDRFVWIHDEPVGHISQYAGWCVARLTRTSGVPVTLNGQGGDEVFAGYWQSYMMHLRHLALHGHWLSFSGHFAGALSPWGNSELPRQVPIMLRRFRDRAKAVGLGVMHGLKKNGTNGDASGAGAKTKLGRLLEMSDQERRVYEIREMYLPRLLKWDDRNFMAFSVEGRYPFLDHELIELVLSFAPSVLYASGWTKEPLRAGLQGMLPDEILRRKTKLGFEAPQDRWLSGPLRPVVERWLEEDAPLWAYIEPKEAKKVAEDVWKKGAGREAAGHTLFRLFNTDRWMRAFFS